MSRRRRKGRALDGVLVLDKPPGATSNAVLQQAKRLFQAAKAGHTGSLDPLATGVLPICFGEATKFSQHLLEADKAYLAHARLGVITETGDSDGAVVAEHAIPAELDEARLESILAGFRGAIEQVPSMYSALKHQGRPLYEWAREGITIERKPRPVTIHQLTLEALTADSFAIAVRCTKGTYIRSLVEDIGQALGCGAHVTALRRTEAGPFRLDQAYTLDALEAMAPEERDACLQPADTALQDLPEQRLNNAHSQSILNGQPVKMTGQFQPGWVRLYAEDRFLGLGEILLDGRVAPRRLVSTAD
ncbi:tRNA pseudouridine(55) synthase TruB [Marinobacteraceae bacterium S3BR75-40.1]